MTERTASKGSGASITCPTCGSSEFEKRGERRTYHPLGPDLEEDGWSHGEITMDADERGDDIVYCTTCDSMFTEEELRKEEAHDDAGD